MDTTAERVARERDFHNQRFADDSERETRVGRFYLAIKYGFDLYRQRVHEESQGRSVLEYGCGNGNLAFDLSAGASHVTGIDISDVAIERATVLARSSQLKNVSFVVNNAEAMTLPDGQVDVVFGSGIVHHLNIPQSMREVRRVLRKGGIAIFAEPLGHNPLLNWYRNRTPELRTPDEHPLLEKDLREIKDGFSWSRITYFGLIAPLLGVVSREPSTDSLLTRLVWRLDSLVCRIPGLRRWAWYCLVELKT
jgi:ubiquinone/menaquinone biosynthesis C-methylase UbiE